MSVLSDVYYISDLEIIDEFAGEGNPSAIKKFYLLLHLKDKDGGDISLSPVDIQFAVANKVIQFTDCFGYASYTLSMLESNPDNDMFILKEFRYDSPNNIITFEVASFQENACIAAKVFNYEQEITSTCYFSYNPSYFYLQKG